jgi:hypothetical protein
MMRSSSYARTSPEARQGFAVFAVRLVVVIMARELIDGLDRRQRLLDRNWQFGRKSRIRFNEVESGVVVTQ